MGDRISISFRKGDKESVALFSHWEGEDLKESVEKYLLWLDENVPKAGQTFPLERRQPGIVMLDFTRWLANSQRHAKFRAWDPIMSGWHLGQDDMDGDNSDNGHWVYDLDTDMWDGPEGE